MDILLRALLQAGLTLGAYFYDFKGANYKNRVISFTLFSALLLMLISWQSLSSIKRYQEQQQLTLINASLKAKLTEEGTKNKNLEKEPQVNLAQPSSSVPQQLPQSYQQLSQLNIQYFQRNSDPQKLIEKLK